MNRERSWFWLVAGGALGVGLLLRLWFVSHLAHLDGDTFIYGGIAKTWLQHGVYGFTESGNTPGSIDIRPTLIRLPGYPMFLAACFRLFGMEHYRAVMNVQVLADMVSCWLAGAVAGRLFGIRAQLVVLCLAAMCPFTANYTAAPLSETLVLTSITLTFYGFVRWQDAGLGYNRWLWVTGGAMAWSVLLRPEQGLLAASVLLAMLWLSLRVSSRRRLRPALATLPVLAAGICVLLPLLPWTIRNWQTFRVIQPLAPRSASDPGEFVPTGFPRWYRTWAIDFASTEWVYWNYTGDPIQLSDLPNRAFDMGSEEGSNALRDRTGALLDDYNEHTAASPEIDARFGALADERIRAHPGLYYVALPIARLLDMMLRPRTEMMAIPSDWWKWSDSHNVTAFAGSYAALNLAYMSLGCAGFVVWRWRRRGRSPVTSGVYGYRELAWAMAATVILRSALLLTLDNSEVRYTLEFFPVLFVCAGALFACRLPSQPAPAAVRDGR